MLSVIMAGGVGERFWPASRRTSPKQLLDLTGRGSMISLTLERVRRVSEPDEILVMTNENQVEAIGAEIGSEIPADNIIGEPVARNTAPTVGLAAVIIRQRVGNVPFMVLPADHIVGDPDVYDTAVRAAERFVTARPSLLTFGIKPTRPETGYGYIRVGDPAPGSGQPPIYRGRSFHEKPTPETAAAYYADGGYYWNSGMFLWKPGDILDAMARFLPDLAAGLGEIEHRLGTEQPAGVLKDTYHRFPSISIDYGIMEKADNVVVLDGRFAWNDVGSWESIRGLYPADEDGNVTVGDHIVIDGSGNTVFSPKKFVGVVGVDDVVIVDGGDAILVCKRDRVQQVRDLVREIKKHKSAKII